MNKRPGRITVPAALTALLLLAGAALGVVRLLQPLVDAGVQTPALGAPAEPTADPTCPSRDRLAAAAPQPVAAGDLIECPDSYDGVAVEYTGEVVRAVLRRGNRAWIQVNDDPYALDLGPLPQHRTAVGGNSGIPVSIPTSAADQLRHVGNHHAQGDIIHVVGPFHRADPTDGGGPTIQATTATIKQPGQPIHRPANPDRTAVAAVMALAALATAALNRLRPRQP